MILDLTPVIARLQATLTGFKSIGGSAELDAVIDLKPATPAAFVLPLAESAVHTDLTGGTHQRISQRFGVLLCVSNVRDPKGAQALTDLATLRTQLRTALVGWIADAATQEPAHFVAGRTLKMDGDGRLWWLDEFEMTIYYWST